MKGLVFGAGNIGRGFLGLMLAESGYEVTFVDVNEAHVKTINQEGAYPVYLVTEQGDEEHVVNNVRAVFGRDVTELVHEIVSADIILTAVGKKALSIVAPFLATGILERIRVRPRDEMPVVVIACENVHDNSAYLAAEVMQHVPQDQHSKVRDRVSFPNCMIDRIVPNVSGTRDSPLAVWVEEYSRLAVDAKVLLTPFPALAGVEFVQNLDALLEQKLFTLNMAHAIVGYYGWLAGHQYVHEAATDSNIRLLLDGAFDEVGKLLCSRHPSITQLEQRLFGETVARRFSNTRLKDTITRVTTDPKRKLGHEDRLIKPAVLLLENGMQPTYLTAGAAAALSYHNPDDAEGNALRIELASAHPEAVIASISGVSRQSPVAQSIASHYLFRRV